METQQSDTTKEIQNNQRHIIFKRTMSTNERRKRLARAYAILITAAARQNSSPTVDHSDSRVDVQSNQPQLERSP